MTVILVYKIVVTTLVILFMTLLAFAAKKVEKGSAWMILVLAILLFASCGGMWI